MDCLIRAAAAGDAATIAEYNVRMALETERKQLNARVVLAGVQQGLARPELCGYFVAEADGQLVGQAMITYEWSDWRNATFWWLESVYVHPDFRGRGAFRSLYNHIRELARKRQNVCGIRLYVEQDNVPAMSTYRRLGMKPTGHLVYEEDWSS